LKTVLSSGATWAWFDALTGSTSSSSDSKLGVTENESALETFQLNSTNCPGAEIAGETVK
jgi:hypothetical protein